MPTFSATIHKGERMKSIQNHNLNVIDWGLLSYGEAYERQKQMVAALHSGQEKDTLFLVEHPAVVTLGKRGNAGDLRFHETFLESRGVELYSIDRGGQATAHEPGQMVAYPLVRLKKKDLHWYVQTFLGSVAAVLEDYGLTPEFKSGEPGLWVNGSKITSLGVAVKKWVASHGIALNVNNDLSTFDLIVPCGKPTETVTSMAKELGRPVDMEEVKAKFVARFQEAFGYMRKSTPKPDWLKSCVPQSDKVADMGKLIGELQLGTVCQSAHCPNLGECFSRGTATFMILGADCTRQCRFCAVQNRQPSAVDHDEPERVALAAQKLGLSYAVVTSVTRDDLPDGGSGQFVRTIEALRQIVPGIKVEVLVPDFQGSETSLRQVLDSHPDVFNHNVETVPRIYAEIRPQADYQRSLKILKVAAAAGLTTKTGLMLGFGETPEELEAVLTDIHATGCAFLTLGQYLAPTDQHAPVVKYFSPEEFDAWAERAYAIGFQGVAAGPLVRSSYRADEMLDAYQIRKTA